MWRSSVFALAKQHGPEGHGFSRAEPRPAPFVIPNRFSGEESAFSIRNSRFLDLQNDSPCESFCLTRNDIGVWCAAASSELVHFPPEVIANV